MENKAKENVVAVSTTNKMSEENNSESASEPKWDDRYATFGNVNFG